MSVLIKGMKMPKSCNGCRLLAYPAIVCSYSGRMLDRDDYYTMRDESCPLVELPEKHGRLIDAKVAESNIGDNMVGITGKIGRSDWQIVHDGIAQTPTIIEAEGEE